MYLWVISVSSLEKCYSVSLPSFYCIIFLLLICMSVLCILYINPLSSNFPFFSLPLSCLSAHFLDDFCFVKRDLLLSYLDACSLEENL